MKKVRTTIRSLWIHESSEGVATRYPSVGASRHLAKAFGHTASKRFLERLLGVELESFQTKAQRDRWPKTYQVRFKVLR